MDEVDIPMSHRYRDHFTLTSILMDILLLTLAYSAVLITALLRGGHGMHSLIGISTCSLPSWLILVIGQFCCFFCTFVAYNKHSPRLIGIHNVQENAHKLHSLLYSSYFAGTAAGVLGIGGGMILNPIMLQLGFIPEVAAGISGFSVLFTSSATTTQFIIQGSITLRDSVFFLVVSAIGSLLGGIIITYLVKKYKRPSILVWIIFVLIAISAIVLPTMGVYRIFKHGTSLGFEKPC